jgi:hypothetical protein
VKESSQEGTGTNYRGFSKDGVLKTCCDANATLVAICENSFSKSLENLYIWILLKNPFHSCSISHLIALGSWCANAWSFRGVKNAELDSCGISVETHGATESINFTDDMTFGQSTNGGIAGHLADRIKVLRQYSDRTTETGCGESRLNAGVASTNDEDVERGCCRHKESVKGKGSGADDSSQSMQDKSRIF